MKKYLMMAVLVLLSSVAVAGPKKRADKDTNNFRYDIECAGNGAVGTYLVKVWSYSTQKQVAYDQALKNAIHGVIFKGYSGENGCVGQSPLARQNGAEVENADYFKHFFSDGGEYRKYASVVNGTTDVMIVGREYKVGVEVSVKKDDLRRALEEAGVIKSLNYGF